MTAEAIDAVVVGAGVVGLACARALALRGREVLVLERHGLIGSETSARNSEVIHAGIYYPTGSLKAVLCVEGKALLYAYLNERGLPHRRCGKIIVATHKAQFETLRAYQTQARRNGVGELEWLDRARVCALEPAVDALAGLYSPTTGIIDSHAYMLSLQSDLESAGGVVALHTTVCGLVREGDRLRILTDDLELITGCLVNAGGLEAPTLARQLDPLAPAGWYARGRYYGYSGPPPFSRLVYPIAEAAGLGVHVTVDLAGQVRFGPDVEWIDQPDYTFDDGCRDDFANAIARYFPAVERQRLLPGYTGVRPKISPPSAPASDFRIDGIEQHGVPGLVNLLGIESPGLTSSLAIAQRVADRLASAC